MAALTSIILASLVAGETAYNAVSSHKAAVAAKKTGAVEGELYDKQALDATARGEEQANQVGAQSKLLTGAQRVSLAAQGLDIGSGSSADVITDDQRKAQLAEDQIRLNAAREAFGFSEQGRLVRMGANRQAASYNNQTVSTLLGGAANLFSIYQAYGQNKVPRYRPATGDLGPTSVGAQVRGAG
jgi:hypothetical protein